MAENEDSVGITPEPYRKFGRAYTLYVKGRTAEHNIKYPLTCVFDINRQLYSTANKGTFDLYGLSEDKRKDIYFDRTTVEEINTLISFKAGYMSQLPPDVTAGGGLDQQVTDLMMQRLPLAFIGGTTLAFTERRGQEVITHIEAFDGGHALAVATIGKAVRKGTAYVTAMHSVMDEMKQYGVERGEVKLSVVPDPFSSDDVLDGKCIEVLRRYAPKGAKVFVDNNRVHILGEGETLPTAGPQITLSAATGLIGTPKRFFREVNCSMMFEPRVAIGQRVWLQSTLTPWINSLYKVQGVHHRGTISGASSDTATTELSLYNLQYDSRAKL